MSSNFAALITSSKSYYQKFKFNPLYNEDGSPSYIRASLLAVFAMSLILHVLLKPSEASYDNQSINNKLNITQGNMVEHKSFDPFNKSAYNKATSDTLPNEGSLKSGQIALDHKEVEPVIASEDQGWSIFGFDSQEAKENKQLVANRKQALAELSDGAAFLSSCGNINAGYIGCKFNFSKKVSPYYDSNIEAVADGFMITLVAKGEQLKDGCVKFVANSEGVYQAFDSNGLESQKCFMNSAINEHMLSLHRAVDDIRGNAAPSGAKLVANN